eukprot:CCRYP_014126-RC/>CCRYP_014126-RC protein AED:0.49 eAED:0.49 QI:0/0/0/1/0/0/2/0/83
MTTTASALEALVVEFVEHEDDLLDLPPFETVGSVAASALFDLAALAILYWMLLLLLTVSNCFSVRTRFKSRSKKLGGNSFFRF